VIAYTIQIYFDFSGYSDMAIGLARMFGFRFPENFNRPYSAYSITDFWRRWHMSLQRWLRDNLYVPLGGNRRGRARTYVNLFLVMLLGGLWHGASWNFVLWGAWHGGLLAVERARGKRSLFSGLPRPARIGGTFGLVLLSWVLFRTDDLGHASRYFASLLGRGAPPPGAALLDGILYQPYYVGTFLLAAVVAWGAPQTWDFTRTLPLWKSLLCFGLLLVSLGALTTQAYNPFIYFIF
jgi:alginate O-acetyltransferase complex protein AlgI